MIEVWKKQTQPAAKALANPSIPTTQRHNTLKDTTPCFRLIYSCLESKAEWPGCSPAGIGLHHLESGRIIFKRLPFLFLWRGDLFFTSRNLFTFRGMFSDLGAGWWHSRSFCLLMRNGPSVADFFVMGSI